MSIFDILDKNCFTNEGHKCIFPFKYGGKEYNSCYHGHGGYWCPYTVTSDTTIGIGVKSIIALNLIKINSLNKNES